MPWSVYLLVCDKKHFYVGMTSNLEKRMLQHKRKESFYTKQFFEIELAYFESYQRKSYAERREIQIKKWSRAKKKALISGDKESLIKLSKSPGLIE